MEGARGYRGRVGRCTRWVMRSRRMEDVVMATSYPAKPQHERSAVASCTWRVTRGMLCVALLALVGSAGGPLDDPGAPTGRGSGTHGGIPLLWGPRPASAATATTVDVAPFDCTDLPADGNCSGVPECGCDPSKPGGIQFVPGGGGGGGGGESIPPPPPPPTAEDCTTHGDEDGDSLADCFDPDCNLAPRCHETLVCRDGNDNDGDGFVDCRDDEDCLTSPDCLESCSDGSDDNDDGRADCDDPRCARDLLDCRQGDEACNLVGDEDGDGKDNCEDPDCRLFCTGGTPEDSCHDDFDEDDDGFGDCDDAYCQINDPICKRCSQGEFPCRETVCGGGLDEDRDNMVDCADPDCSIEDECNEEFCRSDSVFGGDFDKDGFLGCNDPDCASFEYCACFANNSCPPEDCNNLGDEDRDGMHGCADPDCASNQVCAGHEICNNLLDDDGDTKVDCADVTDCDCPFPQLEILSVSCSVSLSGSVDIDVEYRLDVIPNSPGIGLTKWSADILLGDALKLTRNGLFMDFRYRDSIHDSFAGSGIHVVHVKGDTVMGFVHAFAVVVCNVCGDGFVLKREEHFDPVIPERGMEECDDGNTTSGDGCDILCRREVCGNGRVDVGEECDDGNTASGDGCSQFCLGEGCGNGRRDGFEECDDGNTTSGDGCSATCKEERCGNRRIDFGEQCDDGNNRMGDGCFGCMKEEG